MRAIYACEHDYPLALALAGMSGNLAQCVLLSCTVSMERKESKNDVLLIIFYMNIVIN